MGGLFEQMIDEIFQPGWVFYTGMTIMVTAFCLCWIYLCALAIVSFTGPLALEGKDERPQSPASDIDVIERGAVSASAARLRN